MPVGVESVTARYYMTLSGINIEVGGELYSLMTDGDLYHRGTTVTVLERMRNTDAVFQVLHHAGHLFPAEVRKNLCNMYDALVRGATSLAYSYGRAAYTGILGHYTDSRESRFNGLSDWLPPSSATNQPFGVNREQDSSSNNRNVPRNPIGADTSARSYQGRLSTNPSPTRDAFDDACRRLIEYGRVSR